MTHAHEPFISKYHDIIQVQVIAIRGNFHVVELLLYSTLSG